MAKNRVLVFTDCYFPVQTANSIISHNIIDEMIKRGYDVTCIAINQDVISPINNKYGYRIYNVENTKYAKLLKDQQQGILNRIKKSIFMFYSINRKFKNILNVLKFPDVDPEQSDKAFKIAKNLHDEKPYNFAIGIFRPYSGVSAVLKMKKQFTDILGGAIYLDLISGASKPSFIPRNLYNKLCVYGDKRTFKKLDFLLIAKKGKNIYINDLYKSENNLIKYVNFPVFTNKVSDSKIFFDTKKINLVYAGTLNQDYRNPTSMLRIIEMISNKVKGLSLHLFGRNNCKEIIDTFKKNSSFEIIEHGIVEHDIVISAYNNADLLINISNSVENIIPSKIFELFATGKPIINFNSSESDGLNEFASKYPSFFRVPENIGSEDFNSLLTFIKTEKGKKYDFELIKRNFYENTPEYFVDIIENEFTRLIN